MVIEEIYGSHRLFSQYVRFAGRICVSEIEFANEKRCVSSQKALVWYTELIVWCGTLN